MSKRKQAYRSVDEEDDKEGGEKEFEVFQEMTSVPRGNTRRTGKATGLRGARGANTGSNNNNNKNSVSKGRIEEEISKLERQLEKAEAKVESGMEEWKNAQEGTEEKRQFWIIFEEAQEEKKTLNEQLKRWRDALLKMIESSATAVAIIDDSPAEDLAEKATKLKRVGTNPSTFAKTEELWPGLKEDGILFHRPKYGLHVSLYNKALATFAVEVKDFSAVEKEDCEFAEALISAMADFYEKESGREQELLRILKRFLHDFGGGGSKGGGQTDISVVVDKGRHHAFILNVEVKKERSSRGEPMMQNMNYYVEKWASQEAKSFANRCCCPTFLLDVSGPYLCMWAAVHVGKEVLLDPLASVVALHTEYDLENMSKIASFCRALKNGVKNLKAFYSDDIDLNGDAQPSYFPFLAEIDGYRLTYDEDVTIAPSKPTLFSALAQKTKHEDYDDDKEDEEEQENDALNVVVKFTKHVYGDNVHRLLADNSFAPKLYAFDRNNLVPGWSVVLMERIEGCCTWKDLDFHAERKTKERKTKIRTAVKLMAHNGFVHGDLRPPNVLVNKMNATDGGNGNNINNVPKVSDDVWIVDFDFAGKEGEARFPLFLNHAKRMGWADDVSDNVLITKTIDDEMCSKLVE